MARRPFWILLIVALVGFGLSGTLLAQMESGDRGIMPIDSSGTLEVSGIHVDESGENAQAARYAGWRQAQRDGFEKLWSETHNRPASQAPNLSDSVLDGLVSSIVIEREQIGPNRYIADLGVLFDRARTAQLLGLGGVGERSVPMLLIPIITTAGTDTAVELRNPWQRAWAEFRVSQSPIDYVRISGMGVDPLLVNAAQTDRPGRGWWRNIVDLYAAADLLIAEVKLHRLYPGGPARAQFIGYHGPDKEAIGGFTLTAANSEGVLPMMREGVRRMDALFAAALAEGRLQRDPTLDIPEPPPLPEEEVEEDDSEQQRQQQQQESGQSWVYQVQIVASNVNVYNFAMAHLRTIGGVEQVNPVAINPTGTSYVHVTYRGDIGELRSALASRGWSVEQVGYILRVTGNAGAPPPPQPQPQPAPQAPPAAPATPPAPPQPQATTG